MAISGKRFLIWGAGGHGKVVADLVRATGHELVGFIDSNPTKVGCVVAPGGARVLMSQNEFLKELDRDRLTSYTDAVALAVGDNTIRQGCLDLLGDMPCPALVHPSAVVSPSARLGRGAVVFPAAVINADAEVGEGVIVNTGAIIEHDCRVGACAHVSPGAVLAGGVIVGVLSWVGANATVIPLVNVGNSVTIGAGAVVLEDIPHGETVAGVPARPLMRGPRDQLA